MKFHNQHIRGNRYKDDSVENKEVEMFSDRVCHVLYDFQLDMVESFFLPVQMLALFSAVMMKIFTIDEQLSSMTSRPFGIYVTHLTVIDMYFPRVKTSNIKALAHAATIVVPTMLTESKALTAKEVLGSVRSKMSFQPVI